MSLGSFIRRNIYWVNDFFNKSPIRKQYNDIKSILDNKNDVGFFVQKQYIEKILKHAVQHTRFYSGCNPNNIETFPIINKIIIQENYDNYKVDILHIPEHSGGLFTQRTSGSTGTPFAVLHDSRKRKRRIAELKYFGKIIGFQSHEKLVQLRAWNSWQSKTKSQSIKENIIPIDISNLNDGKFAELCHIIKNKKAIALRGYASSIDLIAQYVKSNNIQLPSLKIIIAGSETLLDSTRVLVTQYIGCNIISQYANEENGILAQESIKNKGAENHFYLNHASYYFEIFKLDKDEPASFGELGRIVVTDLFNYAMPLIRYDTGDTGIMLESDEYSNGFPVLSKLYGRRLDLIYDRHNNPVHPMAIGRILKNYPDIVQWQFIQKNQSKYLLKIKTADMEKSEDCMEKLKELLGGADVVINMELVDEITVLASGKRKPVVNEWKR